MTDHGVPTAPDFAAIRDEFALPVEFPADVLAEAAEAASTPPAVGGDRVDATAIPLVTIDPPGSKDLDQAVGVARAGGGFRVHYAIADLGAVVVPGGAIDAEVRRRGQTAYLPDGSVPLHPPVLSEDAASLLPEGPRAAVLWTIDLDAAGEVTGADVRRAVVRSLARLDYAGVQADVDAGSPHPAIAALPEVGRLRRALAVRRGAIELELPEQEVVPAPGGGWTVALRERQDVEEWNAEISLLTGTVAARMMLDAGIGLLRTLPAPDPDAIAAFRRTADELGIHWPAGTSVAELLTGLRGHPVSTASPAAASPTAASPAAAESTTGPESTTAPESPGRAHPDPGRVLALRRAASTLLRGAGYTAFDVAAGAGVPDDPGHGGIGGPYAHVTAPLRRLVDRFGTELCLALAAGEEPPAWLREALPLLPAIMEESDTRAARVARACRDRTEAAVLAERVGEEFAVVVLRADPDGDGGEVYLPDPPVFARCEGSPTAPGALRPGATVAARLTTAEPASGALAFAVIN